MKTKPIFLINTLLTALLIFFASSCKKDDDINGNGDNGANVIVGSYPSGTVHCIPGGAEVVDVTNLTTGDTWMDRNLGASRKATSNTDSLAYGDLYQWGRFSDGHQCRNSEITDTQSSSDTPGHGDFITSSCNWRLSENNDLWQGVNGKNNPCPHGYRLPTENELDNERQTWATFDGSPLELPFAGRRRNICGSLWSVESRGYYWSGTVRGSLAYSLSFTNSSFNLCDAYRAEGLSVRCIKD